jgi:hypothetical protein
MHRALNIIKFYRYIERHNLEMARKFMVLEELDTGHWGESSLQFHCAILFRGYLRYTLSGLHHPYMAGFHLIRAVRLAEFLDIVTNFLRR